MEIVKQKDIESRIFTIRDNQVMIDSDLAEMYRVQTKRLNEQVKRNTNRFPGTFRFQLTKAEKNELVANCDRFENLKHASTAPYAFTEQGVVTMLSAVLRSDTAIGVSVQIINAFVQMRKIIYSMDGYKQTKLEVIPEGWKVVKLSYCLLRNADYGINAAVLYNENLPAYLRIADIIESGSFSKRKQCFL